MDIAQRGPSGYEYLTFKVTLRKLKLERSVTIGNSQSTVTYKIAFCFMAVLVSGCALNQRTSELSDTGSGNISFSISSTATYRRYLKQQQPKVFVVTVDGERGFYTFCTSNPEEKCHENTSGPLLDVCREKTGKSCRIFAMDGHVVWTDPGQWRNLKSVGLHYYVDHRGIRTDKL